jgi:hypothetical protein
VRHPDDLVEVAERGDDLGRRWQKGNDAHA